MYEDVEQEWQDDQTKRMFVKLMRKIGMLLNYRDYSPVADSAVDIASLRGPLSISSCITVFASISKIERAELEDVKNAIICYSVNGGATQEDAKRWERYWDAMKLTPERW